jgi:hypothetical protein
VNDYSEYWFKDGSSVEVYVRHHPNGVPYVEMSYEVLVSMLRQLGFDRSVTP